MVEQSSLIIFSYKLILMFPDLDNVIILASPKCMYRDEYESMSFSGHLDAIQDKVSIKIYLPLNGNMASNSARQLRMETVFYSA
jgi:hypothetical protein